MLAIVLLLQTYDRVSDDEAIARGTYDIRWKVALGIGIDDRPFVKSTLQLFRAQLILKDRLLQIFQRSLEYARQSGYMKKRKIRAVLDTTNILGRGAVKDTYNLLADGIRQLIKSIVEMEGIEVKKWVEEHRIGRYFAPSIKGEADVDWDDERARQEFLRGIVV